jgi:sulfur relay (sulfurtransferase) DsrC/TusE family protein
MPRQANTQTTQTLPKGVALQIGGTLDTIQLTLEYLRARWVEAPTSSIERMVIRSLAKRLTEEHGALQKIVVSSAQTETSSPS